MRKKAFFAVIGVVLTAVIITTVTFAWFSSNKKVGTNTASGKSGTASLKFLIGPDEGNMTETIDSEVEIAQVNSYEKSQLFPVTTSDLQTFLYCPAMTSGYAKRFDKVEDESRYYHGKLYLRLESENISEDNEYKIYLDSSEEAGGVFGTSSAGFLLNASRLGLKFEDKEPIILKFNEERKGRTENNTEVGGKVLTSGYVLDSNANPVQDPAEEFSVYSLDSSESDIELPEKELVTIPLNTTVALDIYFYLEGCDEDCMVDVSGNECDIHLAFYAISSPE